MRLEGLRPRAGLGGVEWGEHAIEWTRWLTRGRLLSK